MSGHLSILGIAVALAQRSPLSHLGDGFSLQSSSLSRQRVQSRSSRMVRYTWGMSYGLLVFRCLQTGFELSNHFLPSLHEGHLNAE